MLTLTRFIFIVFLLLSFSSYSQRIKEKNILSFRVYDYTTYPADKEYPDFSPEDISKMKYYEISLDSLKGSMVRPRRLLLIPFFKGSSFATVDLKNGKRKNIVISSYGGFYRDVNSGKFYEISGDRNKKFQHTIRTAQKQLHKD